MHKEKWLEPARASGRAQAGAEHTFLAELEFALSDVAG